MPFSVCVNFRLLQVRFSIFDAMRVSNMFFRDKDILESDDAIAEAYLDLKLPIRQAMRSKRRVSLQNDWYGSVYACDAQV